MKIVVSVNVSPHYISFFSCRSTQNVARIKRLLSLHIVIKPLNKKNTINFLLCWGVTLLLSIPTLHSLQLAGRYIGDFGNFLSGFAKSPRVPRSSWILNECNLYFKTVKYCILSEICMIKTTPHSTVSPQTVRCDV